MKIWREFYINGEWVSPVQARDHLVINPTSEEPCVTISVASKGDVDRAVGAAKAAFPVWSAMPPARRAEIIAKILPQYLARAKEMGLAISMEMGAPIDFAQAQQVASPIPHIESFLEAFKNIEWVRPFATDAPMSAIVMEPIGVVGLITPWNWPINQIVLKAIPAMLAGCTCVLKPSEESPLNAMIFADICHDAGVPPGVFNLINGDGAGAGSDLSSHPDVAMISFTGSTRAGKAISKNAAETLKRVTLELGGKGANLIFADADDKAVLRNIRHMMSNSGQSCNAPSRMLVERSVYEKTIEKAADIVRQIPVGPADQPGRHIGPVVNKAQWEKIQSLIQKGIDEGARLVVGGPGLPDGFNRGYYVKPTVFADVRSGMAIEREEIFGPVLCILPFDSEEEAIRIANDTPYGLTNYVQTQDQKRANRLAHQLCSGMVEMNGMARGAGASFGGVKQSGLAREGGLLGIEEFLISKSVSGYFL